MKKYLILLVTSLLTFTGQAQTFNLTVNNGYGSGNYRAGDTVHVWSKEIPANSVFDKWTGNTGNLADLGEWHTTLVMPAGNTTLTANFRSVAPYTIKLEQIRGVNNLKDVYYYFPAQYKGVIYFSHGSGGDADNWIDVIENRQMVKDAIADTFAAVITEAEEITLNTDLDGDGKMRWSTFPLDSVANIDMANIKAITDTLIKRGVMKRDATLCGRHVQWRWFQRAVGRDLQIQSCGQLLSSTQRQPPVASKLNVTQIQKKKG